MAKRSTTHLNCFWLHILKSPASIFRKIRTNILSGYWATSQWLMTKFIQIFKNCTFVVMFCKKYFMYAISIYFASTTQTDAYSNHLTPRRSDYRFCVLKLCYVCNNYLFCFNNPNWCILEWFNSQTPGLPFLFPFSEISRNWSPSRFWSWKLEF